ncbi:MAG: hypothetical protein ACI9AQ_002149 [Dinoroseobacter sp.]|jgi:hypothetical protein
MSDTAPDLTERSDHAAGRWRDKMRALGYYDGYLGFCPLQDHDQYPAQK